MRTRLYSWTALLLAAGALLLAGCAAPQKKAAVSRVPEKKTPSLPNSKAREKTARITEEQRVQAYAHYAAGLADDLNGRPADALREYVLSLEADPRYEPLLLDVARRLLREQKNDQAIALLQRAAAAGLDSASVYGWLGLAYSHSGKPELAIEANRTAIKKTPAALGAYQNLSQLYLQLARTNLALEVLEEASRQKDVDAEFLVGLGDIYSRLSKAGVLKDAGAKKRIVELLDRAAQAPMPAGAPTVQRLADAFSAAGEFSKAKPLYERLLKEAPELPMLREKLVNIYLRTGQKADAIKLLEEIRKENPTDPQNYFFLGGMAYEEKNFAQAAEYYETALQLSPDFEQLYYDLAALKISLKKPAEALEVLSKARQKFKLNFTMEFYSGVAEGLLENYQAAIGFYISAEIVARATEPSRLSHQFYYQFGAAYERAGQFADAEKQFRRCLELNPNYAEALNYMGYMWADRGEKLEEALSLIEQAVKLQPKNAAFLDSLAWVLYKLNRPAEALPPMQQAISLNEEPDATLFDHLGDIQLALKNYSGARDAWLKSIKAQPSEQIQKKIEKLPKTDGARSSP